MADEEHWPALPLAAWQETMQTLHMWTQIVGKVRLAQHPYENHWWQVPLYVTAHGLTTLPIPYEGGAFQIEFDFVRHRLVIERDSGAREEFALVAYSVAAFYERLMRALSALSVNVSIWPVPVEVDDAIPFTQDESHAAYDAIWVERFFRALWQAHRVLMEFRGRFIGKCSPVHFFWGGFDLAVTRFSGRAAPEHPPMPNISTRVVREAYSHEVSSAGFWPGIPGVIDAAFYSYAYPEPEGYRQYPVRPEQSFFHEQLGEFVLPYDVVRRAEDPDAVLMDFLQSTYVAAAELAGWDRAALERDEAASATPPSPPMPRPGPARAERGRSV